MTPMAPIDDFDPQTYAIIGAAQRVHTILGSGYLERVYQCALAKELAKRGMPFEQEVELPVVYDGEPLDCTYRCDFVIYDEVLVELKALREVSGVEESQVINYLKAGPFDVGLLLNFGAARLEVQRLGSPRRLNHTKSSSSVPSVD
jgi:GxxExxY protein